MKQSDIKKLYGRTFVLSKLYYNGIWNIGKITIGQSWNEFKFCAGDIQVTSLNVLMSYLAGHPLKATTKDFIDLSTGKTMYDVLHEHKNHELVEAE